MTFKFVCRTSRRRLCVLALSLGTVLPCSWSPNAAAQSSEDISGARALARQGIEAFEAGAFQEAYDLLIRAETLYHAPVHLLYIARSAEKLGRLVEALEVYNRLAREKISDDAPEAFLKAQESAREEMGTIEPRLARVTVKVEGAGSGQYQVHTRGKEIPPALIGAPHPIDPGEHEFSVISDDFSAQPVSIFLAEGANTTVTLHLRTQTTSSRTAGPEGGGKSSTPAYVAIGVGGLGVALGTVFAIDHFNKKSAADRRFTSGGCERDGACSPQEQKDIIDLSSKSANAGTLSWVGYGVGAVGVGAVGVGLGVALLLMKPSGVTQAHKGDRPIRPILGISYLGASGRF